MPKVRTTTDDLTMEINIQGGTYQVRPLTASQLGQLRARHSKIRKGAEQINGAGLQKEMFERVVLGWPETGETAVTDMRGNPLECTIANKRLVAEHDPGFVAELLEEIERETEARRNGELGNLPPGPHGPSDQDE
jgi:hypothetical protein